MSPQGGRSSSSVLTGTKLGSSPIACSDAITAMYMMIHMAKSPARDLRSRFHDGTLGAQRGGIAAPGLPQTKIVEPCLSGNVCGWAAKQRCARASLMAPELRRLRVDV